MVDDVHHPIGGQDVRGDDLRPAVDHHGGRGRLIGDARPAQLGPGDRRELFTWDRYNVLFGSNLKQKFPWNKIHLASCDDQVLQSTSEEVLICGFAPTCFHARCPIYLLYIYSL